MYLRLLVTGLSLCGNVQVCTMSPKMNDYKTGMGSNTEMHA